MASSSAPPNLLATLPKRFFFADNLLPTGLTPLQRHVLPFPVSSIDLPRARDLLLAGAVHLLPLREPAHRTRNAEQYREHIHREPDRLVDQTGVEVDVRVQLALDEVLVVEGDLLQLERD